MRSNQKLICFYILALMLLNFHDNLIISTRSMDIQRRPRQLMDFFYILRGIVFFFVKFLIGAVLLGIGIVVATILITGLVAGLFSFGPGIAFLLIGSFALVALGSHEVWDIKRVCFDHAEDDDVYLFSDRRLEQAKRSLSQVKTPQSGTQSLQPETQDPKLEKETPKPETQAPKTGPKNPKPETQAQKPDTQPPKPEPQFPELKDLDVTEFIEKDLSEIVSANAREGMELALPLIRKIKEMNEYRLWLARGYGDSHVKVLLEEDIVTYTEAVERLEKETTDEKTNLYKRKTTRIVVSSAWQFLDDMEKEINPDRFDEKRKKEFEKLKADSQGTDPKKKAKADEKIQKITGKYLKLSEKEKEKLAQKFAYKLWKNGLSIADMKSNYVLELLSATFPKIYKEKIKSRREAFKQKIKEDPKLVAKFAEIDGQLKKAEQVVLKDNTEQVLEKIEANEEKDLETQKKIEKSIQ